MLQKKLLPFVFYLLLSPSSWAQDFQECAQSGCDRDTCMEATQNAYSCREWKCIGRCSLTKGFYGSCHSSANFHRKNECTQAFSDCRNLCRGARDQLQHQSFDAQQPIENQAQPLIPKEKISSYQGVNPSNFLKKANLLGIEVIKIDGGSFEIGSKTGNADEQPPHSVSLAGFYLSKAEITVKQYRSCVEAGACSDDGLNQSKGCHWNDWTKDNHPINCVDWHQARQFAQWLEGDLPSEAQWEYAAKSRGENQKFPWGDNPPSCEYAVLEENGEKGCGTGTTWPVCSKIDGNTKQGLCDMSGNVWEWTLDEYQKNYKEKITDEKARCLDFYCEGTPKTLRVGKGAGYFGDTSFMRASAKSRSYAKSRSTAIGFRVSSGL